MDSIVVPLPDPTNAPNTLKLEISRIEEHLKIALPDAVVSLAPYERDEAGWSRTVKVAKSGASSWVEVELTWSKGEAQAELDVWTSSRVKGLLSKGVIVPVIVAAVVADGHPEWLPVLRGVRVLGGAVVGLLMGMVALMLVPSLLGVGRSATAKDFEKRVETALRTLYAR